MKEVIKVEYIPQVKDKVCSPEFGVGCIYRIYRSARYLADVYKVKYSDATTEYVINELNWDTETSVWQVS